VALRSQALVIAAWLAPCYGPKKPWLARAFRSQLLAESAIAHSVCIECGSFGGPPELVELQTSGMRLACQKLRRPTCRRSLSRFPFTRDLSQVMALISCHSLSRLHPAQDRRRDCRAQGGNVVDQAQPILALGCISGL
jgi:hypothetical protein